MSWAEPPMPAPKHPSGPRSLNPLTWLDAFVRRHPFVGLFLLILLSNVSGSIFNFSYNRNLIIERHMTEAQEQAFWQVAAPWYNVVAYPLGLGIMVLLFWPMWRCRRRLQAGLEVVPSALERCRRLLVALPVWQMIVNTGAWLPGGVFFPLVVLSHGGPEEAEAIWLHFGVSFFVSTLLTTAQSFFLLEWYLIHYLYADFFQDARPADVQGVPRIPFRWRLRLFWSAVALVPMVALLAVAWNFPEHPEHQEELFSLFCGVFLVGLLSGLLIFYLVGRDLVVWTRWQAQAAREIAQGNFDFRIPQKRPDQWGRLSDAVNDMADALGRAQREHEVFGMMVGAEIRDEMLTRESGLGGSVQEVTVLFADLRDFTRRSAGQPPERIVALLNRFFTLAVEAIEDQGGHVNKFLGDGFMALFGVLSRRQQDHADQAVRAAAVLLSRLAELNLKIHQDGHAPLDLGIGIHTGPALVGSIGASLSHSDGTLLRCEFTAIGETVNLCQRIEQLTKHVGGPILLSEAARQRLQEKWLLEDRGSHDVPGMPMPVVVHQVLANNNGAVTLRVP